jgi:hypothetical protein
VPDATAAPQKEQKRDPSGNFAPQEGQKIALGAALAILMGTVGGAA